MSRIAQFKQRYPEQFSGASRQRVHSLGIAVFMLLIFAYGLYHIEFSPVRIWHGLGKLGEVLVRMLPPDPGLSGPFWSYMVAMGETVAIAFLGTLLAALLSVPIGFMAARNTTLHTVMMFFTRRSCDTLRSVDMLIWALIWINVVGLGPFAGVLAIICSDTGSFGKLYSEAIETADRKAVEGVASTGGSRLHQIRFGILPQVLPVMLSQVLYFFESNTRSATIIGIIGAGGIGLILSEQIRMLEFQPLAFVILLVLVTVMLIDLLSTRLRMALIGPKAV
jgi:phosphonate transport system permease protein